MQLNTTSVYKFILANEENNHLYVIENLLRDQLPHDVADKCHLYSYMTNAGAMSIVLEALNPGDYHLCNAALSTLKGKTKNSESNFEIAFFVGNLIKNQLENYIQKKVLSFQDKLLKAPDAVRNKLSQSVNENVNKLDKAVDDRVSNSEYFIHPHFTSCIIIGVITISFIML